MVYGRYILERAMLLLTEFLQDPGARDLLLEGGTIVDIARYDDESGSRQLLRCLEEARQQ